MKQPTLMDRPTATIDPIPIAQQTDLAIADHPPAAPATLMEFRKGFMLMPVPQMIQALTEYGDWRKAFRKWLLSVMVEGIHYGWAVGFSPKWCDSNGNDIPEETATHSKVYSKKNQQWTLTPIEEFLPKRNLLLAGADLVCDLLWVRDEYSADMETWQQLGSKPGNIVRKCKLFSKTTEEFIGEGTGGRVEGEKFMGLNSSVKMADNSAKRCAVLNAYGLRDLFTSDMEEPQPPQHPNPEADPAAPQTAGRDDRVSSESIAALVSRFKKAQGPNATPEAWSKFVAESSNRLFDVKKSFAWCPLDIERVDKALSERFDA